MLGQVSIQVETLISAGLRIPDRFVRKRRRFEALIVARRTQLPLAAKKPTETSREADTQGGDDSSGRSDALKTNDDLNEPSTMNTRLSRRSFIGTGAAVVVGAVVAGGLGYYVAGGFKPSPVTSSSTTSAKFGPTPGTVNVFTVAGP